MSSIKETIRQINLMTSETGTRFQVQTFLTVDCLRAQRIVVSNLAMMYNLANESTIIVETDLESNLISETFGLTSKVGLSDFLDNPEIESQQIVNHVKGQNIDAISSGSLEIEKAKFLLGDSRFLLLMEELKKKYSHILINTPVFEKIDSFAALNKVTDGFILLTSDGTTYKKQIKVVLKDLNRYSSTILGYVNVKKD